MSLSLIASDSEEYRARVVVALPRHASRELAAPPPTVDIVVPVHNQEEDLAGSVRRLHTFLRERFPFSARITIADSASADASAAIAEQLAADSPDIRTLRINETGRGRALAAAWLTSDAAIVACIDLRTSTDFTGLLPLIAPVMSGHSEVSVGSRRSTGARVSRAYNRLLRTVLRVRVRDARCGFKAVRSDVARRLVPEVVDRGRFFDAELLVRAERAGLRIHELPVEWTDYAGARADDLATTVEDLRGIWRLATRGISKARPHGGHGRLSVGRTMGRDRERPGVGGEFGSDTGRDHGRRPGVLDNALDPRRGGEVGDVDRQRLELDPKGRSA